MSHKGTELFTEGSYNKTASKSNINVKAYILLLYDQIMTRINGFNHKTDMNIHQQLHKIDLYFFKTETALEILNS